ncbi:hypothetical protein [Streptomyces sp. NPDC002402]
MNAQEGAQAPELGTLARDVERDRIGVVMASTRGHVWLRPRNGGREWVALPKEIEPVSEGAQAAEELRSKVADVNRRSRGTL